MGGSYRNKQKTFGIIAEEISKNLASHVFSLSNFVFSGRKGFNQWVICNFYLPLPPDLLTIGLIVEKV